MSRSLPSDRRTSLVFYWAVSAGLLALDGVFALHRMRKRTRLRVFLGLAITCALILLGTSLSTVRRIDATMQTMTSDCLVGINSSIAMGATVTDAQAEMVARQPMIAGQLPWQVPAHFAEAFSVSFDAFEKGVFQEEEAAIKHEIALHYSRYLAALWHLASRPVPAADWKAAFEEGTALRVALRADARFNAQQMAILVTTAKQQTREVYQVFALLALTCLVVMGIGIALLAVSRLFAEDEG